jgi:hypothetical protein
MGGNGEYLGRRYTAKCAHLAFVFSCRNPQDTELISFKI